VLAGHHHYYDRTRPLDGITYVVSGGGSSKLYKEEPPAAYTAAFQANRNHYGLVDVYADRLEMRVLDVDGRELDRFAVAIRPASDVPGSRTNPLGTELPPLESLPEYQVERLSARPGGLPRPW